jgi:transposase-like protein
MFKLLDGGAAANSAGRDDMDPGPRPAGQEDGGPARGSALDELVREGARQMLASALLAEVADYVGRHAGLVDGRGRRLVVRNGYHEPREVVTGAGAIEVRQPRVDHRRDESGQKDRFASVVLPPWARKSPQVADVLPLLYLHGLSTGDFAPALEEFLGTARGLSASTVSRLADQWRQEAEALDSRSLAGTDYVYVWVDGVHLKVRLGSDKVCLLVILGVRSDGAKELVALADGYRESEESWADLLRGREARGMRAPVLAVGDGALGFWKAARGAWPEAKEQRCWFHKSGNVLSSLPKSVHSRATRAMTEIRGRAGTRTTPAPPPAGSPTSSAPSGPGPPKRSPPTPAGCWPSTNTPPSTGPASGPPTPSSPSSPPCG